MPSQPTPTGPSSGDPRSAEPQTLADQAGEDAQFYRSVLNEIVEMGLDIARVLHHQVKGSVIPTPTSPAQGAKIASDAAIAFDRITHAIRRTIALARKLAEPARASAPANPAPRPPDDPAAQRSRARRLIIREVKDAIDDDYDGDEADRLYQDLRERMDSPDLDDDLDNRPLADIIADITGDLGLTTPPAPEQPQPPTPQTLERPGLSPGPAPLIKRAASGPLTRGAVGAASEKRRC